MDKQYTEYALYVQYYTYGKYDGYSKHAQYDEYDQYCLYDKYESPLKEHEILRFYIMNMTNVQGIWRPPRFLWQKCKYEKYSAHMYADYHKKYVK